MMKKVPKRRFKGFLNAGDWEQRKLGEIVSINPRTELPNSFKYVDLESVIGTNLIGYKKTEKENAPSRAQRLASFGDIFYQTVRPYQRNNYLFEKDDDDVVFSTGYAQLRSELDSYFLFTLIQTDSFVRKVLDNCTGTSYPAINSSELGKILISVPQDKLESHQIGTIFRVLDNVITLHQCKLEKLQATKKALLYELFPIENNRRPKRRFKGFTGDWEQRKLGDLADGVFGGGTPNTSIDTYWNGNVPWIQSSNLMDDKIENFINDKSITNLAIKESTTKLIPANSIAIVTRVGVGKVALIREKFTTSQDFLSFHCRHEHNPLFMAYQISRLMKVKSRLLQGTSIKGITKSEVLESEVLIPKGIEEENKIADFLSSCDNLITLHQRKLEKLKNLKAAYLNEMFV